MLLLWSKCVLFTNKMWEFIWFTFSCLTNVGLSISELHEHAYSYCSLLWCEKFTRYVTNKLSEYWCHIIKPYLFTKFHTSKHAGKRVTRTCIPYCNVKAEVVYRGFPQSNVFAETLICLFPVHHQSLYLYQVSYVGVLRLEIREFNPKKKQKKMHKSENGYFEFDIFAIVKMDPFFTKCSFDGIVTVRSPNDC